MHPYCNHFTSRHNPKPFHYCQTHLTSLDASIDMISYHNHPHTHSPPRAADAASHHRSARQPDEVCVCVCARAGVCVRARVCGGGECVFVSNRRRARQPRRSHGCAALQEIHSHTHTRTHTHTHTHAHTYTHAHTHTYTHPSRHDALRLRGPLHLMLHPQLLGLPAPWN